MSTLIVTVGVASPFISDAKSSFVHLGEAEYLLLLVLERLQL